MSTQSGARIRFEQGLDGAQAVASGPDVLVVVVDVLSFSTCVSVAADRGVVVIPARWNDARAAAIARRYDAQLAGPRSKGGISLSPLSIRSAEIGPHLVLPSPNGATICDALADGGPVVAGCLRNVSAVAEACRRHLERGARSDVAFVAAGERWAGESLRSAPEDVWGAGAIIEALDRVDLASMEALGAADSFRTALARGLPLDELTSGRELVERGFAEDVAIAGELDWSSKVPHLVHGAFVA
ncbi:2-phosphosulfolactate phosphatase [uncultured Amnibacterium sp.]|uniref:2-phosphosulfolactate phosphatase n=1 Tax=uncultured Amnibacterium sp. TaxID=1631851 RepID=UPI0035CC02AD